MIIVAQDRMSITEKLDLYINSYDVDDEKIYIIENNETGLGIYKTEERAKQILEELNAVEKYREIFGTIEKG